MNNQKRPRVDEIINNKVEFVIEILKPANFIGSIVTISNCSKGLVRIKFFVIIFIYYDFGQEKKDLNLQPSVLKTKALTT